MIDRNKQQISEVENSTINQAQRDVIINNGLSAADVIAIVNKVVSLELSQYSKEAERKLEERLAHFSEKLVQQLAEQVNDKIHRFNEPSLQFAVREAAIGYIKSGSEEEEENLIDLMIERVKVEEHTTMQQLVDQAIKIVPTLSPASLMMLSLLTFRQLSFRGHKADYDEWIAAVDRIINNISEISTLDIEYLTQAGCAAGFSGLRANKKWEDSCRDNADLLFRHPAPSEAVDAFYRAIGVEESKDHKGFIVGAGRPNGQQLLLLLASTMTDASTLKFGFEIVSSSTLYELLNNKGLEYVRQPFDQLRNTMTPFSDEEIIRYFENKNPNWRKAIELLNNRRMISLSLTPVGTYIGSRQLAKLSGRDIPMEIFYHN